MERGTHLLLDCCTRSLNRLADLTAIYEVLEEVPVSIGMTLVAPPIVVRFPHVAGEMERFVREIRANSPGPRVSEVVAGMETHLRSRHENESGISGFSIIAESHFSIHTWPERHFFSADLYSCKQFRHQDAVELIFDRLDVDPHRSNVNVVPRGLASL